MCGAGVGASFCSQCWWATDSDPRRARGTSAGDCVDCDWASSDCASSWPCACDCAAGCGKRGECVPAAASACALCCGDAEANGDPMWPCESAAAAAAAAALELLLLLLLLLLPLDVTDTAVLGDCLP